MREFWVDLFCDNAVPVHQIIRPVIIEALIRAQNFREIVEAALESRRGNDLVHPHADTFYFGKSDLVNLLRRQVRGGLPAHMKRVSCGAVGQRRCRDRFCRTLLDSTHLRYGHPRVTRDNITEWNRIVAVLQALFRRFQKLPVKVVVELFLGRESIARNGIELRETLVEVADSRLQALSRIVAPPAVLSRETYENSRVRGLLLRPVTLLMWI